MLTFLSLVVTHTPAWVWGLLALLVGIGVQQLGTREVAAPRLVALPLAIGAWSLVSAVGAFGPAGPALPAAAWLAGAALGVLSNRALDLPRRCDALPDGRYRIAGSVAPLLLMLGVFVTRYANGIAIAMHPALRATTGYVVVAAFVFGVPAGLLAARARKVLGTRRAAALAAA